MLGQEGIEIRRIRLRGARQGGRLLPSPETSWLSLQICIHFRCLQILCMFVSRFHVSALQAWGQQLPKGVLSSMLRTNTIRIVRSSPLLAQSAFKLLCIYKKLSLVSLAAAEVWGCRTCGSRSAADVRICWSCLGPSNGISHPHPLVSKSLQRHTWKQDQNELNSPSKQE